MPHESAVDEGGNACIAIAIQSLREVELGNACIAIAIQSLRRSNQALNEEVNHSVLGSFARFAAS